jgi:hypothetical protein
MQATLTPASLDGFWRKLFPGQIPDRLRVAEPLDGNEFELEGQRLVVVEAGRTDTAASTSLHIPSIGLIVAGDVVYSGIHPISARPMSRVGGSGFPASTSSPP